MHVRGIRSRGRPCDEGQRGDHAGRPVRRPETHWSTVDVLSRDRLEPATGAAERTDRPLPRRAAAARPVGAHGPRRPRSPTQLGAPSSTASQPPTLPTGRRAARRAAGARAPHAAPSPSPSPPPTPRSPRSAPRRRSERRRRRRRSRRARCRATERRARRPRGSSRQPSRRPRTRRTRRGATEEQRLEDDLTSTTCSIDVLEQRRLRPAPHRRARARRSACNGDLTPLEDFPMLHARRSSSG